MLSEVTACHPNASVVTGCDLDAILLLALHGNVSSQLRKALRSIDAGCVGGEGMDGVFLRKPNASFVFTMLPLLPVPRAAKKDLLHELQGTKTSGS